MTRRVALITGAGRGIGRATAIGLGQAGYALTLTSRTEAQLRETALLAQPAESLVMPVDVSDPVQASKVVEQTIRRFGRLDALVNVAGTAPVRKVVEMGIEEWRAVMDTNVSAVFFLSKHAWPHLRQAASSAQPAAIVNISSLASRDPFPGFAAYGAAKAAVNLFGLAAAREGQADHILVHTIAPGAVETSMFREILSKDQYPTERCLTPDDVAEMIVRCATGQLRHLTGEIIWMQKSTI